MTIVNNVFTVSKLIPLLLFLTVGLFFIRGSNFSFAELPNYRSFSKSVMLLVFAFSFEASMIPSGEVRNPARSYPFALLIALAVVAVVYLLVQVVCIGTLPGLAGSDRPLADAAQTFLGRPGVYLVSIGAIIAMSGTLNAVMLFTSRSLFAMAEQGQLPAMVGRVHPRFRTPHVAIIVSAVVILVVTLSNSFISALTISAIVRLMLYVITAICLIVLRKQRDQPRPEFEVPGGLAVPIAAIALSVWLLSNISGHEARDAALAAAIGLVLYGVSRGRTTPKTMNQGGT